ncbi:unnamed protein product, partial [marine sediment metagenome]
YEIRIANRRRISKGKVKIEVDGKAVRGPVIPPHGDGRTHQVTAVMLPDRP